MTKGETQSRAGRRAGPRHLLTRDCRTKSRNSALRHDGGQARRDGSAAAFHAGRRRKRVVGLEQFTLAYDRGSSHGRSRVTRQAYFEYPA